MPWKGTEENLQCALQHLRRRAGMTQGHMGLALGASRKSVNSHETGYLSKIRRERFLATMMISLWLNLSQSGKAEIAERLDVDLEWLEEILGH